jgi:hypothetical protein
MLEFQVDDFKQMDDGNGLGGNLSVHFPSHVKPLIIVGHDKCIFKQYCLSKKTLGVTMHNVGISTKR